MPDYKAGAFINYSLNLHSVGFSELPGVPNCCNQFNHGRGWDFSVGGIFEKRISDRSTISLSLAYERIDAELSEIEIAWISIDDELARAEIKHTIDANFASISLSSAYNHNIFNALWLSGGMSVAFLTNASFRQQEELIRPVNRGTFENGRRIRNEREGAIGHSSNLLLFMDLGVQFELPLNRRGTTTISPRLTASLPLNSAISGEKWNIFRIQAGVYIKFSTYDEIDTPLSPR
ncbi:MAG: hypothetical protein ACLFQX_06340 [Candidatus Kapaibacterium sp.]